MVAATLGHPDRIALAKCANAVLGAAGCLLLAALAARLSRRRSVAVAAGLLAALCPGLVLVAADVQDEPLYIVLILSSGFLLLAGVDRPSSNLTLAAGVLLALAALTRPTALVLAVLLLAPLGDSRWPPRVRAHLSLAALLGFGLALGPWTLRNALVFHEFLPVNDGAGVVFYQGNSDWAIRFYRDVHSRAELDRWAQAMHAEIRREGDTFDRAGPLSPRARSRRFAELALAQRRVDPWGWASLELRKAWDWLRPYPNPIFWPKPVVLGVGAFYTALSVLAVRGLAREPRRGVRLFVVAFLLLTMLPHIATLVLWRYRIGSWDPVLVLYGVAGAWRAR